MPATVITNSPNIASLDSDILANLCNGNFYVDILPSIWIGSGASNVMGANVKVTNPYNIIIKNFPTSGYDIYPPMTSNVVVAIPTQAGNFQYGQYTVEVQLVDANGTIYSVSKLVNICVPDPNNKTRNYGTLSAQLNGVCKDGAVYIIADTVPNYQGSTSNSQINAFTLTYPTVSGKPVASMSIGSFAATLYEGQYIFNGTICANYNLGDNISAQINYQVNRSKTILCSLDESCIYGALSQLDAQAKSDCTDAEKEQTQNTIINALRLLKTIEISLEEGFDASDFIAELETTLGCVCTCNCNTGAPIINNNPAKSFTITGCGFTKTTVDLTDIYTFDSSGLFELVVPPNGGVLNITAPVLTDCTLRQTLTFSIAILYSQVKGQINNPTEYNYWASILNKSWDSLDISCVGVTQTQWNSYTYAQRSQAVFNALCSGGNCTAVVSTNTATNSASDVNISWVNVSGVYDVSIYMDGIQKGNVLAPVNSFKILGAADGNTHTYEIFSKCTNGALGNSLQGSFAFYGCPAIAPVNVSLNSITGATCPYNLTSLVSGLPVGITAEWHNQNNTLNSSLVSSPTTVADGAYYVFGKNSDGCYSLGTQVILTCSVATNCSAPQTLIVEAITGGYRVRFQSAAFAPPLNSYTVKRRLASDPDVPGSYTTIGTPTWNASVNRWEILDNTGVDNTLYSYRAISNCTSSAPYIDYIFANIICPTISFTETVDTISYSFTNSGAQIDKYEVSIYTSDGITLIHTDTIVPSFPSPITGTFVYLDSGSYLIHIRAYIGTYYKDCPVTNVTTEGEFGLTFANINALGVIIQSIAINGTPILVDGVPINDGGSSNGFLSPVTGILSFVITGTLTSGIGCAGMDVNGAFIEGINISAGAGTYSFTNRSFVSGDDVVISLTGEGCPT